MKRMLKLSCKLLYFVLILSLLTGMIPKITFLNNLSIQAEEQTVSAETISENPAEPEGISSPIQPVPDISNNSTDNEKYRELDTQRTAVSKTYQLESKRFESVVYGLPVHYMKDGKYQPIDNSLQLTTGRDGQSIYTNRANAFTAGFAASLSEGELASVTKDGYRLGWSIAGLAKETAAAVKTTLTTSDWARMSYGEQRRNIPDLSSQIVYTDVLPDTNIELQLISDRIKENIILSKNTGLKSITQNLSVESLVLELQKDNSILAVDTADRTKTVFILPPPYVFDAGDKTSSDITVTLEETTLSPKSGDGSRTRTYRLTYTLDTLWMEKAIYPVTIDPTVFTSLNPTDIKDTLVSENFPYMNYYLNAKLNTGEGPDSWTNYSLIRFQALPEIGSASMVQYAGIRLTKKTLASADSTVSIHEITSSWESSTATWYYGPSFSADVEDWQTVHAAADGTYEWDITRIAKKWYTGGANNGVLLKDMSHTGTKQEYYSSDSGGAVPYAYFVYTNYSGLEGCWDYTSSGLGRSGTANVNLYNGNLVYTHNDLTTTGNRMPIAISHVFNSTTKDSNDSKMLYGKGWQTNYDQRVEYVNIAGINYYKYTDEDGTIHYFSLDGNTWKDESGLNLNLTVVSNLVTINDKQSNKLVFYETNSVTKPGFLNYIEDRNSNRQTIGYDANNRISQVTDGAGRIVIWERDANGYLYRIREQTGASTYRYTTFAYTSSRLTSITYSDGEVTNFVYDTNGNIDYVNGIANDKLDIGYASIMPYRVNYLAESATVGGVTTDGAHAHLTYGYNRTTLEDSEGRPAIYQFNDFGNTVCVVGPDGGAAYAGYGTTATAGDMSKATTASNFQKFGKNYLVNHSFETDATWSFESYGGSTGTKTYATDEKYLGSRSLKFVKTNTTYYENVRQDLNLEKGKTYTLSGYVKTSNVSDSSLGAGLIAVYYDSAWTPHSIYSNFAKGTNDWNRQSLTFTIPSDAATGTVLVYCLLYYSTGTAWFDCVQLEEGSTATSYIIGENAEQFSYNSNNDLTKYIDTNGKTFSYTYDTKHNPLTATSAEGIVYTFTYDSYGNQLSAKVGGSTDYVRSNVAYDQQGNYTDNVTDPFGKITDYTIDSYKGLLNSVTDPMGNTVSNTYDPNTDALTGTAQTSGNQTMANSYDYPDDLLTHVAHSSTSGTVGYDFEHNDLGWTTGVQVTGTAQNLITYTLQARTGRTNALIYGNGTTINYGYDSNDQLKLVSEGTTGLYAFEYDNSGNIGYVNDQVQTKKYWYEYDSLNRLGKIRTVDASGNTSWSKYGFTGNSLSSFIENILGVTYTTSYVYDSDSRSTTTNFGTYSKNIVYDSSGLNQASLSTIKNGTTDLYKTQINYAAGDGTNSTKSYRVSQVVNDYGDPSAEALTYTYDDRGYITKIVKDANNYSDYRYDGFGQLIRENYKWGSTSYTMIYNYDVGGNMDIKNRFAFVDGDGTVGTVLETLDYAYSDNNWKDKLTSYDGVNISYDEIGNPLSDGTWTYDWTQGRKLEQISRTGMTVGFKYNASGIRTEKTVNGVVTVYNVVGDRVTWEKTGTGTPIYYTYDSSGSLWGIKYNGNQYFYVRNGQGDIIRLIDSTGAEVVAYSYDAWGRLMDTTGSLAASLGVANPYRYRGYRYDAETGLYYLQSRYYDPATLRYLNADGVVGSDGDLLGSNMFAYCKNNPVMMSDPSGCWPTWGQIFTAVAIVAIATVFVLAVVASAGAVGIAAGVAAASIGATGAMVSAAVTIGTVATYAVAAGIGACALSNAGEVLTGTNVIRDKVMSGNQEAYDKVQTVLAFAGGSAIAIGQTNPGTSGKAATPSKDAKEMHRVEPTGKPFSSIDKLYKNKPGEFSRTFYDYNGNSSLRIDFSTHSPGSGHTNPHMHFWDSSIGRLK